MGFTLSSDRRASAHRSDRVWGRQHGCESVPIRSGFLKLPPNGLDRRDDLAITVRAKARNENGELVADGFEGVHAGTIT